MVRAPLHRRAAAGAALTLALSGAIAVGTTIPAADAATVSGLLPPSSGILPGPSPSGDGANDGWGPCVPDPDPDAAGNCQGWSDDKSGTINGTDDAPNVIVGSDFAATGTAAETEGLLVVDGDASFDKGYNVGWAIGSGVIPADRADWLIVGGDATVTPAGSQVQVGTTIAPYRTGDIRVGGTHNFRDAAVASSTQWGQLGAGVDTGNQDPPTQFQNAVYSDTSVLADDHYDDLFGADGTMATYSQQCYAPLSDPGVTTAENQGGTLAVTHGTVAASGGTLTLTGPGTGDLVVFDLPATIGSATSPVSVDVTGIPTTATILLNAAAGGSVAQFVSNITVDGEPNPAPTWRDQILYNYPNATSVRLGGPVQLPGSILMGQPGSTLTVGVAGTNGRIYTPGTLVNDGGAGVGASTGTENHAYQFTGELGCAALVPATFSIQKAITGDGADAVPADTEFTVDWTVTGPSDSPDLNRTGTLTVLADGTPANGPTDLADGDEVTFSEPTLPTVPGIDWGTPSITPNPVRLGGDSTVSAVTVTNTATLQRGGFTIRKVVSDDSDPGASTTTFTGSWTCDAPDAQGDDSGTWSLEDGGTVAFDGFPTGTTCSVSEDRPDDDNGTWSSSVDPAGDFTITEGTSATRVVTVTNTFTSTVGGFQVEKIVQGDAGATVDEFTIDWSCDQPNADGLSSGSVTLRAGDESDPITGFPVGTTCTISEPTVDDATGTWEASISPATVTIGSEDTTQVAAVTVTNTFTAARGGFTIQKEVTGDPGASTTSFDIAWQCSVENVDGDGSGAVHLADGETATIVGFPVGTTCAVTEETPTDDNGTWRTPAVDPGEITVAEGDAATQVVTVTNTFVAPTPTPTPSETTQAPTTAAPSTTTPAPAPTSVVTTPDTGGGGLATTGFDILTVAAIGAFLVALGLAAILIGRRRHG
ncbi:DUF5979 domain-containing protein [Luteimicrobium sp. NPDC057192]|uniref:DUF5979 domain-containing protein n=1 Tax=Luteimicrobium sp. NPDC057192 TaxID=3346042 RepID=UPI00362CD860